MSFVNILYFKNHKMTLRILLMSLLPLLSFAQSNSKVAMPKNTQSNEKGPVELKRNALYNLDEIKVRWKKAALENCPGVPCPTFSVPGPCSSIVATPTSPSSASVSFVPPTSDGGSAITGYIVTATSTPSAPAKRKSSAIITVTGTSSPIVVTGLTFGVNYIFSVVATNAAGGSPPITTTTTVTPCTLNTAGTASSSPTLIVNTALTNITIATTGATGIGTATGLPAGVTAVWASNVITISGTPTASGTFNYTIPLTGGCGSVNATGTITVTTAPAATVPGAPTTVVATAGNASASVAFVAPSSTGGSVITGYTVTSSPGGITAMGTTSPINVTGLTNGTSYRFAVVATNAVGNSVASAASAGVTPAAPFTCGTSTVSDIDNNSYNTVLIGTQCWTKTNLRVRRYNDNTEIRFDASGTSTGTSSQTWGETGPGTGRNYGAHTIYAHDSSSTTPSNLTSYGYLYNWYAVAGIVTSGGAPTKNICPTGWHVPTDSDWNKLVIFIDPSNADTSSTSTEQSTTAGTKLKKNDALWTSNTGTDDYDFSALPGGFRFYDGGFNNKNWNAFFWSSTEINTNDAWSRYLYHYKGDVRRGSNYGGSDKKSIGASVRCLKD